MVISRLLLTLCMGVMLSSSALAYPQKAHVHGLASLKVVVDGQQVDMTLTIPAMSLVGFEYTAKTTEENSRIEKAKNQLLKPGIVTFYQRSGFLRREKVLEPNVADSKVSIENSESRDDHGHHHHDHDDHNDDIHSEFQLKTKYSLPEDQAFSAFSTALFTRFPGIETVIVSMVMGDRQFEFELSPDYSKYEFNSGRRSKL